MASTEERLRAAGWYETDDGLWTADGVPAPMGLSGARIVLTAVEAAVKHRIACRSGASPDCLHGEPAAAEFGDDLPMSEDGTYLPAGHAGPGSPASVVCTACYMALGQPLNPVLPGDYAAVIDEPGPA